LKDSISNDLSNCAHQCNFNNSPSNEFTGIEIHSCSAVCNTNEPIANNHNVQTPAIVCSCDMTECPYYVCDCPDDGNTNSAIRQGASCLTVDSMGAKNDHSNEMINPNEQSNGPLSMISS